MPKRRDVLPFSQFFHYGYFTAHGSRSSGYSFNFLKFLERMEKKSKTRTEFVHKWLSLTVPAFLYF